MVKFDEYQSSIDPDIIGLQEIIFKKKEINKTCSTRGMHVARGEKKINQRKHNI